jgi:hypothetical protein
MRRPSRDRRIAGRFVCDQPGSANMRDGTDINTIDPEIMTVLASARQRYSGSHHPFNQLREEPVTLGQSGTRVRRFALTIANGEASRVERWIVKRAGRHERRVLALLRSQEQPGVPFAYVSDTESDGRVWIALLDVGETRRPTSLELNPPAQLAAEALALAAVHCANGPALVCDRLQWVPRLQAAWFERQLEAIWRPRWRAALARPGFRDAFGDQVDAVEEASIAIVSRLLPLLQHRDSLSLIHNDLNPSNVRIFDGGAYLLDWETAAVGPFYIDVPHHFCNAGQASIYQQARAHYAASIPKDEFAWGYDLAARWIGFRYMAWTLDAWVPEDPNAEAWVRHYVALLTTGQAQGYPATA